MKVAVVGSGAVGKQVAFSLINEPYVKELMIIDRRFEKANANKLDLEDAARVMNNIVRVRAGAYELTTDYDYIVICASVPASVVEDRLQLFDANKELMQSIVSACEASGFVGKYILASNPVDVLTQVVANQIGDFTRAIGSGTILDSVRLERIIADQLELSPRLVDAKVIGEHGDSSVPLYSQVIVAGLRLEDYLKVKNIDFDYNLVTTMMRESGYYIFNAKGETSFGIAASIIRIIRAVSTNNNDLLFPTVVANGAYDLEDVMIALPVRYYDGVAKVVKLAINDEEQAALMKSAQVLKSFNCNKNE